MAWGDEDNKTLYLWARRGLFHMRLNISGAPAPKSGDSMSSR